MIKALVALLLCASCVGCVHRDTLIRVHPDGSGTLRERVVLRAALIDMSRRIALDGGYGGRFTGRDIIDEAGLQARVRTLGKSVRLLHAEHVRDDYGEGYVAEFAFSDVNRLMIHALPVELVELSASARQRLGPRLRFDVETANDDKPAALRVDVPLLDLQAMHEHAERGAWLPHLESLAGMRSSIRIQLLPDPTTRATTPRADSDILISDFDADILFGYARERGLWPDADAPYRVLVLATRLAAYEIEEVPGNLFQKSNGQYVWNFGAPGYPSKPQKAPVLVAGRRLAPKTVTPEVGKRDVLDPSMSAPADVLVETGHVSSGTDALAWHSLSMASVLVGSRIESPAAAVQKQLNVAPVKKLVSGSDSSQRRALRQMSLQLSLAMVELSDVADDEPLHFVPASYDTRNPERGARSED